MSRLHPLALASVLALLLVAGCGGEPDPLPADVRTAWEQYREAPTENTYLNFIQVNRAAARDHAHPDDAQGVLHQLLALEAQSDRGKRRSDLYDALAVVGRVDELDSGGVLETYDEVVPGSAARFLAAREQVAGLLE